MRLFVYGTLQDEDVLRLVAGREVPGGLPAVLEGYVAVPARGASYPTLRRSAGGLTRGRLLPIADQAVLRALERYEGSDYRRLGVRVRLPDGREHRAVAFAGAPGRLPPGAGGWSLERWRRRDKAGFLRRTFGRRWRR